MRRLHERAHRGVRPDRGRHLSVRLPVPGTWVDIRYHRPHLGPTIFHQRVLESTDRAIVTFQPHTPLEGPILVAGRPILAPGSPVVWFTFPDAWHDIGLFHLADGRPTGVYANVLTPVEILGPTEWRTTDLYLDVWISGAAPPRVLDEDELTSAVAAGLVDARTASRAREEASMLLAAAAAGRWPPEVVGRWSLERARAASSEFEEGAGPTAGA